MLDFLSITPEKLGSKLLQEKNSPGVYVIDEQFVDGIQKRALFNAIPVEGTGWDQGYCIDFIFEEITTDRTLDEVREAFVNTPAMQNLFDTFFPLSEEVAYLDDDNTKIEIAVEYYFDATQEEAQNNIAQLVEQFAILDDAVKETLAAIR